MLTVATAQPIAEGLYSKEQAAVYLGISGPAIDKMMKRQEITVIRIGRNVKFEKAELDRIKESRKTQAQPKKPNRMKPGPSFGATLDIIIGETVKQAVNNEVVALRADISELKDLIRQLVDAGHNDTLLNKKAACELLGITYPTLRALEAKGSIKPVVSDGHTMRYSKRDLLKIKATRKAA